MMRGQSGSPSLRYTHASSMEILVEPSEYRFLNAGDSAMIAGRDVAARLDVARSWDTGTDKSSRADARLFAKGFATG